ncbi:FecR family protein [Mangrovibacterium marinum]|uniref:FecR family protein n=1 Tax=Mangrovibacterium marinum TaxID=1639118 RepID=A0A2T5C5E1_9BACT|nr:FecR family protein [Mangrovibacterium marinum]PTN10126.1 FecR family protein [Mangrovibacterium marinum]
MKELIRKYLSAKADRHDQSRLLTWLRQGKNLQAFNVEKAAWEEEALEGEMLLESQYQWNKIQKRLLHQSQSDLKKKTVYLQYFKYASVVLLFLTLGITTYFLATDTNQSSDFYTEVSAPAGQKTQIMLPDSSVVRLNGGTMLRYNNSFGAENRFVELDGEAYFDVRKSSRKAFIVHTRELDVKVYGTSFNVNAYANDHTVEVGLKHGSVGIEQNKQEVLRIKPGQLVTYSKEANRFRVNNADISMISAWTNNELVFDEKPFNLICKYLERWYGVDIALSNELIDNQKYTFRVKTESLHEVLELIRELKPINYQIDGETVKITKP